MERGPEDKREVVGPFQVASLVLVAGEKHLYAGRSCCSLDLGTVGFKFPDEKGGGTGVPRT